MSSVIFTLAEIQNAGSKIEQGQLFKDRGVPMVLKNLEWEYDLGNYDFKTYEDPETMDIKVVWRKHESSKTDKTVS